MNPIPAVRPLSDKIGVSVPIPVIKKHIRCLERALVNSNEVSTWLLLEQELNKHQLYVIVRTMNCPITIQVWWVLVGEVWTCNYSMFLRKHATTTCLKRNKNLVIIRLEEIFEKGLIVKRLCI